jgi:hypothetical protein
MIHRLSTACGFFVDKIRAKFSIYDQAKKIPQSCGKTYINLIIIYINLT